MREAERVFFELTSITSCAAANAGFAGVRPVPNLSLIAKDGNGGCYGGWGWALPNTRPHSMLKVTQDFETV